jgi:hypothetical protein
MICPKCQSDLPEGAKFCKEYGRKIEAACPECGKGLPPDSKFCPECGCDLRKSGELPPVDYRQPRSYTPKHLSEKILTSRSSIEGERKLVTVMFADVAGFTAISEKLDPEDVHRIMNGCCRILVDAIHRFEGTVGEFRGDGVMALFGAPIAHEDHARRVGHAAFGQPEKGQGFVPGDGHGLLAGQGSKGAGEAVKRTFFTKIGVSRNIKVSLQ